MFITAGALISINIVIWNLKDPRSQPILCSNAKDSVVVVDLLFYVHGKHLRSCRDGQLT